jgi:hypothetical protein
VSKRAVFASSHLVNWAWTNQVQNIVNSANMVVMPMSYQNAFKCRVAKSLLQQFNVLWDVSIASVDQNLPKREQIIS